MQLKATIFFLLCSSFVYASEPLVLDSGHHRNTLIELYTSEGCSSCPPSEEYLNTFTNNDALWKKWVPLAFHVDYWDYIGWRDVFAQEEYGKRQSRYAKLKKVSTVYTPAFVVNGKSWRRGLFSRSINETLSDAGNLRVSVEGENLQAQYKPINTIDSPLKINVAILAMGLKTEIKRGENAGRTAHHEFVVVGYKSAVSKNQQWKIKLPEKHYTQANKHALAVWVSHLNDPTPLQVVGGYLSVKK